MLFSAIYAQKEIAKWKAGFSIARNIYIDLWEGNLLDIYLLNLKTGI